MTYRAARLLRLPGRTVQVGEPVGEGEIPPHKLGSYLRLGMLIREAEAAVEKPRKSRKVRSATITVEDTPAPKPTEEDET